MSKLPKHLKPKIIHTHRTERAMGQDLTLDRSEVMKKIASYQPLWQKQLNQHKARLTMKKKASEREK